MDWNRWWGREGMPHAVVRVNGQRQTLRIHTDYQYVSLTLPLQAYVRLQLLTLAGWVDLHEIACGAFSLSDSLVIQNFRLKYFCDE